METDKRPMCYSGKVYFILIFKHKREHSGKELCAWTNEGSEEGVMISSWHVTLQTAPDPELRLTHLVHDIGFALDLVSCAGIAVVVFAMSCSGNAYTLGKLLAGN